MVFLGSAVSGSDLRMYRFLLRKIKEIGRALEIEI